MTMRLLRRDPKHEPGEVGDLDHGLPGPAEPPPEDEQDEPTRVNDDEGA